MKCKDCSREKISKNGTVRGIQRDKCKDCGLNFVIGDRRTNPGIAAKKALAVILYSLDKGSYTMIGKILDRSPSLIYRWIVEAMDKTEEPEVSGSIQEMEFDEMWHFMGSKKNKMWILKALNRGTRRTVAWVTGYRDASTFRRLYDKVKHLTQCTFDTDAWDAFAHVLPKDRHTSCTSKNVSLDSTIEIKIFISFWLLTLKSFPSNLV